MSKARSPNPNYAAEHLIARYMHLLFISSDARKPGHWWRQLAQRLMH